MNPKRVQTARNAVDLRSLALLACLFCALRTADAAEYVGTVTRLVGQAHAYVPGVPGHQVNEGDQLVENTRLVTGKQSALSVTFTDDTRLMLGAGTIVNIDNYRYQPTAEAEPSLFSFGTSILTGVVRTVTGLIAKRQPRNAVYRTQVGTIGVRGTHFTVEVEGDRAVVILLEPEVSDAPNAIEVSNAYGTVEIADAGYGTEIPDAVSPPSSPRRMQTTNNMTRLLRSANTTRRVRVPRSPMR